MGGLYIVECTFEVSVLSAAASVLLLSSGPGPAPPPSNVANGEISPLSAGITTSRCKSDANYSYTHWRFRHMYMRCYSLTAAMTRLLTDTHAPGYRAVKDTKNKKNHRQIASIVLLRWYNVEDPESLGGGVEGRGYAYHTYILLLLTDEGCMPI